MNLDQEKRLAGEAAADLVEDGMTVGLGSGSTAVYMVRRLGERVAEGLRMAGLPTSEGTAALAREVGIPLTDFSRVTTLDLTLDGIPDQDLSGRDVSRAPEWQFGADLTYDTQLGNIGSLRAQASVYYQDENVFYYAAEPLLPDGGQQFDTVIEEYTTVDAFVTYTHSSDKLYFSIYGKNLTDEIYHNASQYVGGLWTFSTYAPPRTYGAEIGITL